MSERRSVGTHRIRCCSSAKGGQIARFGLEGPPGPPQSPMRADRSSLRASFPACYAAIRACRRLVFNARHTKSHSPCTFASPRRLKRRNPSTCVPIQPLRSLRQPLADCIRRTARRPRQLLGQATRRGILLRVAGPGRLPLPAQGHIPVDASRFQVRQVPLGSCSRRPPAPSPAARGPSPPARRAAPAHRRWSLDVRGHLRATTNWCAPSTATCAL